MIRPLSLSFTALVANGVLPQDGERTLRYAHRYDFNETSGSEAVDSAGTRPGTLSDGVMRTPSGTIRFFGNDRSFVTWDRTLGQFGTSDFAVAFRLNLGKQNGLRDLIGNRAAWGHGSFFQVRIQDGRVVAEVDGDIRGTHDLAVQSQARIDDGKWHAVRVDRRGVHLHLTIDGKVQASAEARGIANVGNEVPFQAGHVPLVGGKENSFSGEMDDLLVASSSASDGRDLSRP